MELPAAAKLVLTAIKEVSTATSSIMAAFANGVVLFISNNINVSNNDGFVGVSLACFRLAVVLSGNLFGEESAQAVLIGTQGFPPRGCDAADSTGDTAEA